VSLPRSGWGPSATGPGIGIKPALFSLAMILTYSLVLGVVYGALNRGAGATTQKRRPGLDGV
jgi:hypothetical protein